MHVYAWTSAHMTNWLTSGLKIIIDIFMSLLNYLKQEIGVTLQLTSHK